MQFRCGQCGRTLEIGNVEAGVTVPCPHCGHEILVPGFDTDAAGEHARPGPPDAQGEDSEQGFAEQAKRVKGKKVHVTCDSCGEHYVVGARLSGRRGRCPKCGQGLSVPYPDDEEDLEALRTAAPSYREDLEFAEIVVSSDDEIGGRETAEDALELLHEESDELSRFELALSAEPKTPPTASLPQRARPSAWALPAAGAVALVGVALTIVLAIWPKTSVYDTPGGGVTRAGPGQERGPISTAPAPETSPTTAIAPPKPTCKLVFLEASPFVADGYAPAGPARLFWLATVAVGAGDQELEFNAFGQDVTLTVDDQRLASLGLLAAGGLLPAGAQRIPVRLKPKETRKATFVFDVSAAARSGTLAIRGVGQVRADSVAPAAFPPASALGGEYVECAPRNLKPLLRDPIMAAIQSTPRQTLLARPQGEAFDVSIVPALVNGTAEFIRHGVYKLSLNHRQHKLDCKLRLFGSGNRVLLYLADEPFHQLTYVRKGHERDRHPPLSESGKSIAERTGPANPPTAAATQPTGLPLR